MLRYFDSFNYYLATPAGLEPATSCVTGMRSSQLNYGAIFDIWVGHTPLLSSSPVSVRYGLFNGLQSTPNPSYCGVLGFPDFFIKDSKFCLMVLPRGFEPLSPAWKADNLANLSMGAYLWTVYTVVSSTVTFWSGLGYETWTHTSWDGTFWVFCVCHSTNPRY